MDIPTLRVYNELYKFKLTEEEFKDLQREKKDREKRGQYIGCVKKINGEDYVVAVSHDTNHDIIIKRGGRTTTPEPKSRVLFKTMITFKDIPEEVYTLHGIVQYRSLDTEIKYEANNLEELKDRIIDRFSDNYPKGLGEEYDEVEGRTEQRERNEKRKSPLVEKQLKAIYWLFGEEYEEKSFPFYSRINVPRIIKVFQRKNRRVAIIQINEEWDRECGGFFKRSRLIKRVFYSIKTFKPKNPQYNYVCPNRELYYSSGRSKEIWLCDELFEKVNPDELRVMMLEEFEENARFLLLTPDEYEATRRRLRIELIRQRRSSEEKEANNILIKNIEKQFKKGKVMRHGITFTKKSFSYEGITIKGDDLDKYFIVANTILLEEPNFQHIYEGYIEYLLEIREEYRYYERRELPLLKEEKKLCVGKVKITITPTEKRGYLVNDYRISKEDLEEVIKKAINYGNQKTYDDFLSYTSKVCLEFQKALRRGMIEFKIIPESQHHYHYKRKRRDFEREEDEFLLALPVKREKGKNYVLIKGEKYGIKNVRALINLAELRFYGETDTYLKRTIKQLYKSIRGITPEDIAVLVNEGIIRYKEIKKEEIKQRKELINKSKEFLNYAIKLTKAVKKKGFYLVKGKSGKYYKIDLKGGVYLFYKGEQQHLCLIDLKRERCPVEEAEKNDMIARRLLMLSEDKKVAREVWGSGDRMDKWWLELLGKATAEIEV